MNKPAIPKGTRDFLPAQMAGRKYIFSVLQQTFEKYGFMPLETPAMELQDTLRGKYGEEGNQLIFNVLNSGDFLKDVDTNPPLQSSKLLRQISKKALRYDLTVPLARVVAMYPNEILFPFRRYQMQPVWRADSPQKGRYQEFYQCDVDIVGTQSLTCEAELLCMIQDVFDAFKLPDITIKINHRQLLSGIVEQLSLQDKETDVLVAIDKWDKIGTDGVLKELTQREINAEKAEQLLNMLSLKGNSSAVLQELAQKLTHSPKAQKGIEDLQKILDCVQAMNYSTERIQTDITLARGLSYYTGAIIEVKINNVQMGSVLGGGRYDHLIGMFSGKDITAIGISFGVDRIYDVLKEKELLPTNAYTAKVLVTQFNEMLLENSLSMLSALRTAGIAAELYPEPKKIGKQFEYADKKGIPYVVIVGENEVKTGIYSLKELKTGKQESFSLEEIIHCLKNC
jgi:histidyl-tRNA synthetase